MEDWRRNANSLIEGGSRSTCGFDSFWYSLRRKQVACLFFKSTSGIQVLCGHTLPAVKGAASLSLQRMMPLQEDPSSFFIQGHWAGKTQMIKCKALWCKGVRGRAYITGLPQSLRMVQYVKKKEHLIVVFFLDMSPWINR